MRAVVKISIFSALLVWVLTGVFSEAQNSEVDDVLQGMLDAVEAEAPDSPPPDEEAAQTNSLDEWEPRPIEAFIPALQTNDVEVVLSTNEPAAVAEEIVEEMAPETNITEDVAVETIEETTMVIEQEEQGNPLDEVLDAVKALTNEVVEAEGDVADAVDEVAETDVLEGGISTGEVAVVTAEENVDEPIDDVGMKDYEDAEMDSSGQLISVRLNKVGLEEAITLFAQLSGANIIVPELTEAAKISVNLKDVEWRPALQSILDSYNYELYQKVLGSNVYSVRRRPVGAPEAQHVETYKLQYATVPNVAKLVRELLPESAKVSEFASRNMLVVKSTESALNEVRSVIEMIDKVRQQVFIESKFMELTDSAQKDLGIDWQVLKSYGFGTMGETRQAIIKSSDNTKTTTILKSAEGQQYEAGSGYANEGSILGGIPIISGLEPTVNDVSTDTDGSILTSVLSADQFRLVLSALAETKGVNVVSNPKIIVANEEQASINIQRREPNLLEERTQSTVKDQPDLVTYKQATGEDAWFRYGIELNVIPSINTESNITVKINPSLTRKFGDKTAGSTTFPIIDEKSIQTIFSLASGQTAAIGGLTEVEDSELERKVPILGSIPLLGRLFSWKQMVQDQQETIIFVTVGLANTSEINLETGLPEDTDLAHRQLIRDDNRRTLRKQAREYYLEQENEKLTDMLKAMHEREVIRLEARAAKLAVEEANADNGFIEKVDADVISVVEADSSAN